MAASALQDTSAASPNAADPTEAVADQFVRVMRAFNRAREHYHSDSAELEWHPAIVLKTISLHGPLRLGKLADHMHLDPSTLSRHVSSLVKHGYVERVADQDDGRASVLRTTPKAAPVLADVDARRVQFFRAILADWSDAEIRAFAGGLERFEHDFSREIDRLTTEQNPAAPTAAPEEN